MSIDSDGSTNLYIAGLSYATWGSPVRAYTGDLDVYAAGFTTAGVLQWSTFLGSSGMDLAYNIRDDGSGNAVVTRPNSEKPNTS